jgi:hypothetical protein
VEFISLYIDPREVVRIGLANDWLCRASAPELAQGAFSKPGLYRHILSLYHAVRADNHADFDTALTELVATLLCETESHGETHRRNLAGARFKPVIEFMKATCTRCSAWIRSPCRGILASTR